MIKGLTIFSIAALVAIVISLNGIAGAALGIIKVSILLFLITFMLVLGARF